jgi:dienelactone hydrolase
VGRGRGHVCGGSVASPPGRADRLHRGPAGDDKHPSPEEVNQHEAELQRHGKTYEFYRYDGAGHGFFYYHWPMYRPEQAMDGWEKVFGFFGRYLAA